MLCAEELLRLCQRLGLSNQAQAVIAEVRAAPPARRVRSAAGNVSVRYPSRKMGVIIQAESHRNELAGIYEKEHDPAVFEYYDQPPRIKLVYRARSGRPVGVWHTPDFFVLRADAVGWEEWKMEEDLGRLAERMPQRYVRQEDGGWICPPGERYAEPLGFFYHVRSSRAIDWVFQRNLLFLEDYLRPDCPPADPAVTAALLARVAAEPGLPLAELLPRGPGTGSDDLYALIAAARIYVDLRAAPLAEPERVRVFRDPEQARAYTVVSTATAPAPPGAPFVSTAPGAAVVWDGRSWRVVNAGEKATALLAADGAVVELPNSTFAALVREGKLSGTSAAAPPGLSPEARELLARASPADLQEANRRYALIAPGLSGLPVADSPTPARTMRHWLARWREGEQRHGCGYVGLLPRRWQSGNRQRKLPAETLAALDEFIRADYETLKQKPKGEVYGALVRACEEQGLVAPSYKTFAQAVDQRPRQEQVRKRQGPRAAYQHAPFHWELTLTTPRHGDRPFEIGHIDHTQLDLELRCARTGRNLGRPWTTFLSDAFSRRLLAVYLTFDPPSYRSCMMVLRECVHRHGRLPQIVVVDNGPEFASIYFETLLARYECSKKTRPAGQPRFGSICERLFGTTNTRFLHNLTGNTQLTRLVRQMTRSVDPKTQALWTLGRLYGRLCEWAYEVYDTLEHPALGQTPREAFGTGLAQGGRRPHRLIPYDETFRMFTLPTTKKGTALVQPRLGVKINYIFYWSDAFRHPEVEKTPVPVRYDPFDAGTAYAFVQGQWVRCISEHYPHFHGRSEREMMLATAELRKRNQRHAQQFAITARKLADFLASLEAEETLLEQRLRDAEAQDVVALLEGRPRSPQEDPCAVLPGSRAAPGDSAAEPTPRTAAGVAHRDDTLVIYEDY